MSEEMFIEIKRKKSEEKMKKLEERERYKLYIL